MITLLTDFGLSDPYAGIMKGVIGTIDPAAVIVDLTHDIPARDVQGAAYALFPAFSYFPKGSIHVVVVDPGVGGARKILALAAGGHVFLAPDNGVLTLIFQNDAVESLFSVENVRYFRQPVSRTFHGRDIFAPVAAHLHKGLRLEKLGPPVAAADCVLLDLPRPRTIPGREIRGAVVRVDRFGNLITNIRDSHVAETFAGSAPRFLTVTVRNRAIRGLSGTYGDAPAEQLLALCGSSGWIEIAVSQGSAAAFCGAGAGTPVVMTVAPDGNP